MKKLIVILVLITIIAGSVYAQSVGGWESPQSIATQGRIRSDADNFIRPDGYAGVNFDGWYAMTSFEAI